MQNIELNGLSRAIGNGSCRSRVCAPEHDSPLTKVCICCMRKEDVSIASSRVAPQVESHPVPADFYHLGWDFFIVSEIPPEVQCDK